MNLPISLLQVALNCWQERYETEKLYYKGRETDLEAIKSFSECKNSIKELELAISHLEEVYAKMVFSAE